MYGVSSSIDKHLSEEGYAGETIVPNKFCSKTGILLFKKATHSLIIAFEKCLET